MIPPFRSLLLPLTLMAIRPVAVAQLPSSIDITLVAGTAPATLDVRIRANGASFNGIPQLYFTFRWDATSPAGLGTDVEACPNAGPIVGSAAVTNGGFKYRTFSWSSAIPLNSYGCSWPADQWFTITTVNVTGNTGCTVFSILNDAYTGPTNRDFYSTLNGIQKTGVIVANQVWLCGTDCAGVPNGQVHPGISCNDNIVCTLNDIWSANCTCTGTFVDSDNDGTCDAIDGCPNDPNKIAPGQCGCGVPDVDGDGDGIANCTDNCPGIAGQQGTPCNDNNVCTVNDALNASCVCAGTIQDTDGDGICNANDNCPNIPGQQGSSCNDGNTLTYNDVIGATCVCAGTPYCRLNGKVFLEGPYSTATGQMEDYLRDLGLLPGTEPYTAMGYVFTGGGGETASPNILGNNNANTAKVDWLILELRSAANPAVVVTSRAALVCRDGTITENTGTSPLLLKAPPGSYYVVVRQRNHLPVMTASALTFTAGANTPLDLTLTTTATYGINACKPVNGIQVLWAGDANFDGSLKYTGSSNDRDPILTTVGSTTPNNVVSSSYNAKDLNMDGQVLYSGTGNDRDPVLVNVGSTTPNNVRVQQVP